MTTRYITNHAYPQIQLTYANYDGITTVLTVTTHLLFKLR